MKQRKGERGNRKVRPERLPAPFPLFSFIFSLAFAAANFAPGCGQKELGDTVTATKSADRGIVGLPEPAVSRRAKFKFEEL
jgi:hypothetical protein